MKVPRKLKMDHAIENLGVVGLGVMGFDIAFLYAMKGFRTLVFDVVQPAMDAIDDRREQTIERLKGRNRISEVECETVRKCLIRVPNIEALARAELVTEAVSEDARAKLSVYRALKAAGFPGLLTTNTSSVCRATLLAEQGYDSKRFALTHFFNPVLHTRMVEVVRGDMEGVAADSLLGFLRGLGRQPVETQDISGFVSNGILMIYAVMALRLLEGGARIEQIDQAARELKILPPLFSFDSWKPSIVEDVTGVMFEHRGDAFLRSSCMLSRLARDNQKFYIEQKPNPKIYDFVEAQDRSIDGDSIKGALHISTLVAAARLVELGESPAIIDLVATEGIKLPHAPLKEIDNLGATTVLEELAQINQQMEGVRLSAPKLLGAMAMANQTFYKSDLPNPWLSVSSERPEAHARH